MQAGFLGLQIVAPRSRSAQLVSTARSVSTNPCAMSWTHGSLRISTCMRGPKWRSITRAMLLSSSGLRLWNTNSSTALATYCPTAGMASNLLRSAGKPPAATRAAASETSETALRRHSPMGRRRRCRSGAPAPARASHDGYADKNAGKNASMALAFVRCSKTSTTMRSYSDAPGALQWK